MGTKGDKQTQAGAQLAATAVAALASLGDVTSKKMFGGHGLFHDGSMFGIVNSKAELFLKVGESNQAALDRYEGSRHGKMPYQSIPTSLIADDAETFSELARSASELNRG